MGPKSAQRLAFHLFSQPLEDVRSLAGAITGAKEGLATCPVCLNIMDARQETCAVCSDALRERGVICVVEQPADVLALERSGEYEGLYHVLHGVLSPMNGVGPEQLKFDLLLDRLTDVREVILATSTTVEGEATAMYLARLLKDRDLPVSRIAYGLPVGGDLEYADEVTLGRAITHRREV